jgi:DNA-directed RNA polymerase omega subunit
MNEEYLKLALEKIPDRNALVLVVAKRVSELTQKIQGLGPMVNTEETNNINIALLEIAEGKLHYEFRDDQKNQEENDQNENENVIEQQIDSSSDDNNQ